MAEPSTNPIAQDAEQEESAVTNGLSAPSPDVVMTDSVGPNEVLRAPYPALRPRFLSTTHLAHTL